MKYALLAIGGILVLRFVVMNLPHVMMDLAAKLLGHLYKHHEGGLDLIFATLAWVVALLILGSMSYFVYFVSSLFL